MSLAELREQPVKRTVALAGATGLVGRSILEGLLADPSVQAVHVLGRRKPLSPMPGSRATSWILQHCRRFRRLMRFISRSVRPSKWPAARLHSGRSISTPTLRWLARR